MKTVRPTEPKEIETLSAAAAQLKKANHLASEAKQASDSAKKVISDWLEEKRAINLDALPIGEIIHIEDIVQVKISSQRRLDTETLHAEQPATYQQYLRDTRVKKFEAARAINRFLRRRRSRRLGNRAAR